MGADEKHDATYGGYTPSTEAIRDQFIDRRGEPGNESWNEGSALRFDRWLEIVRAEAKAEALNEVANAFQYKAWNELIQGNLQDRLRVAQPITAWLRARADQHKEEPTDGR